MSQPPTHSSQPLVWLPSGAQALVWDHHTRQTPFLSPCNFTTPLRFAVTPVHGFARQISISSEPTHTPGPGDLWLLSLKRQALPQWLPCWGPD